MAAHILTAITLELGSAMTRTYSIKDYELLMHSIGYAFPFHQLSIDEYDKIGKWCEGGIELLQRGEHHIDHQRGFRLIAWGVIARLYPEWEELGRPETYEDWMNIKRKKREEDLNVERISDV